MLSRAYSLPHLPASVFTISLVGTTPTLHPSCTPKLHHGLLHLHFPFSSIQQPIIALLDFLCSCRNLLVTPTLTSYFLLEWLQLSFIWFPTFDSSLIIPAKLIPWEASSVLSSCYKMALNTCRKRPSSLAWHRGAQAPCLVLVHARIRNLILFLSLLLTEVLPLWSCLWLAQW